MHLFEKKKEQGSLVRIYMLMKCKFNLNPDTLLMKNQSHLNGQGPTCSMISP